MSGDDAAVVVAAFAEALKALWTAAGSPRYTQIASWGKRQQPPVSLPKQTVCGWFNGVPVPEDNAPFWYLIDRLNAEAAKRGLPAGPSLTQWKQKRRAAAAARRPGRRAGSAAARAASQVTDPLDRVSQAAASVSVSTTSSNAQDLWIGSGRDARGRAFPDDLQVTE